jgi:hypothetical protein
MRPATIGKQVGNKRETSGKFLENYSPGVIKLNENNMLLAGRISPKSTMT